MSEMNKPYSGNSRDRLTKLINDSNPNQAPLVEGVDFQFGKPLSTTQTGYNTRVRLENLNAQKAGDQDVFYNRLDLNVLAELPPGFIKEVVTDTYVFNVHGVIDAINLALGLDLTIEEVKDELFTEQRPSYPLTINKGASLAWLDDTTFNFELATPRIWLSEVWRITNLNGLYPPPRKPRVVV